MDRIIGLKANMAEVKATVKLVYDQCEKTNGRVLEPEDHMGAADIQLASRTDSCPLITVASTEESAIKEIITTNTATTQCVVRHPSADSELPAPTLALLLRLGNTNEIDVRAWRRTSETNWSELTSSEGHAQLVVPSCRGMVNPRRFGSVCVWCVRH